MTDTSMILAREWILWGAFFFTGSFPWMLTKKISERPAVSSGELAGLKCLFDFFLLRQLQKNRFEAIFEVVVLGQGP